MKQFIGIAIIFMIIVNVNAHMCRNGRIICIASCIFKHCKTGYCTEGQTGICVCTNCRDGPWIPVIPAPNKN